MDTLNLIFNEELIRKKLFPCDSPARISLTDGFFTKSAVLFTIVPYSDKPYDLVIIHRTNRGSKHRGEMAFPGGKIEPKDKSLQTTALREAEEEIGVPRESVKILGCLHDFPTMTRYIITPFLGIINKDQKLVKEKREVQNIIKVPISFFINKSNFKEHAMDLEGKNFPVFYFNYKDQKDGKKYTIWGATAYMIVAFIETIYDYKLSKLGLKRFKVEEIKSLKDYIKHKREITRKF